MTIPARPFNADALIRLGRVASLSPSPCGRFVAVSVSRLDADGSGYLSDLWRVDLDEGAPPLQLTRGRYNDVAPRYRRDGALAFLSDRPTDEAKDGKSDHSQLWLLPAEGGEPRPLTDEPLGVSAFRFAADADRLVALVPLLPGVEFDATREHAEKRKKHGPSALRYTKMPARHWDHWVQPTVNHLIAFDQEGQHRLDLTPEVTPEALRHTSFEVSTDGQRVAALWKHPGEARINDTGLAFIDIPNAKTYHVTVEDGGYEEFALSPTGLTVAALRYVRAPGRANRHTLEIITPGGRRTIAETLDRRPSPQSFTADGAQIIVTASDDGLNPVFTIDADSGEVTRLIKEGAGGSHTDVHVVSRGENAVVVGLRSTFLQPPEVFTVPMDADAPSDPRVLTDLSGFDPRWAEGIAVEEVRPRSDDGAAIQTLIVRPEQSDADPKGLLWIHGGPVGAWADTWHWRWNSLVMAHAGFSVAMPNPRGSTGYGYDFVDPIWGNTWGDQCYRDLMAVTDALNATPHFPAGSTAAMGGSFGGYMTNWIGVNTDRFKALVTHASLYYLSAFVGTTDYPAWWEQAFDTDPYADRDAFNRFSPSHHMDAWRTPAMVIHGARDYRVPIGEALGLFEALQHFGVESELLIFPDENHFILRPNNVVAWYEAVCTFLDSHLIEV